MAVQDISRINIRVCRVDPDLALRPGERGVLPRLVLHAQANQGGDEESGGDDDESLHCRGRPLKVRGGAVCVRRVHDVDRVATTAAGSPASLDFGRGHHPKCTRIHVGPQGQGEVCTLRRWRRGSLPDKKWWSVSRSSSIAIHMSDTRHGTRDMPSVEMTNLS